MLLARRRPAGAGVPDHDEQRFKLLVDSVLDYAIFVLDPYGHVETWNSGAQRLKGYRDVEVIGRHYSVFYPPELRAQGLPARLLDRARDVGRAEHSGWRLRKDGTRFWADVVITALHAPDGRLSGFAKVTRDMTATHQAAEARERALAERQEAVDRLEELDRWRRDFLASVVHDLQAPVTALTGFVGLLLDQQVAADDQASVLDRVRSNAESLQELILDLRRHDGPSRDHVDLQPRPVALRRFVDELSADLGPLLDEHPVEIDVADVTVHADAHALARILRNLLGNAARHTPPGTPIHVRARRDLAGVTIEVADEGPGIDPALLPRVFDRAARGHGDGTGLGLAIVRDGVQRHGGTVDVASVPGTGTTFRVSLPDAVHPAPPRVDVDPATAGHVHRATRRLLHLPRPEQAVEVLEQFVVALGGQVVAATEASADTLPVDLSLGFGAPRLPVVTDPAARMRLEFALPEVVEDARRAVDLLRAAGRPGG